MRFLQSIFNEKTYKASLPYILILTGVFFLTYSTFGTFTEVKIQSLVHDVGVAILSGGFLALLLKTIQFMGVFKEELEKVIFDPKYLTNRNDLPAYWDKVSVELFKNKFPGISQKLLKDVKEIYFPTKHPTYYEDVEHVIEILTLETNGIATIKKTTTLTIVCNDKNGGCTYEFGNVKPFENEETEVDYISDVVKINDRNIDKKEITVNKTVSDQHIINKFKIKLKGKEKYKIERVEEKKYDIIYDNLISFRANKIMNKLKVEFHYPENVEIILKKGGTLGEFKVEREGNLF